MEGRRLRACAGFADNADKAEILKRTHITNFHADKKALSRTERNRFILLSELLNDLSAVMGDLPVKFKPLPFRCLTYVNRLPLNGERIKCWFNAAKSQIVQGAKSTVAEQSVLHMVPRMSHEVPLLEPESLTQVVEPQKLPTRTDSAAIGELTCRIKNSLPCQK